MIKNLFISGNLVRLRYQEKMPEGGIYAVRSMESINLHNRNRDILMKAVRDEIYTLKSERDGFIFRMTQGCYKEEPARELGWGYNGHRETIGEAVMSMYYSNMDFKFMAGSVELVIPLEQDLLQLDINKLVEEGKGDRI